MAAKQLFRSNLKISLPADRPSPLLSAAFTDHKDDRKPTTPPLQTEFSAYAMAYKVPPIQSLSNLDENAKIELLDHLFEPCSTLQQVLLPRVFHQPHTSYTDFIELSRKELLLFLNDNSDDPRVSKIIAAHPRLGAPKPGLSKQTLSEHSSSEQKSLAGTADEQARLAELNEQYEQKFPGLRYVVFVNGRSRAVVMQNMIHRIERGDILLERADAFNAMCDIAIDRATKLGAKL